MCESLAHPSVLKQRTIEVEFERSDDGIERGIQGIRHEIRPCRESGEVEVSRRSELNAACLQGVGHGRGVGQEANDQPVEKRTRRIPIVGIALENDVIASLPRDEAEWSR